MTFDLEEFMSWVDPPERCLDQIEEVAPLVFADSDDLEALKEAALTLWVMLEDPSRKRLCDFSYWQILRRRMHVAAWSEILRCTWKRGKGIPLIGFRTYRYVSMVEMFDRADPHHLMEDNERTALAGMDSEIEIFRGASGISIGQTRRGMSWTTDKACAAWFASLGFADPICIRGWVKKSNVLAYFTNENEIVVRSGRVMRVERIPIGTEQVPWAERHRLITENAA